MCSSVALAASTQRRSVASICSISLSRLAPCRSMIRCTPAQRTPLRDGEMVLGGRPRWPAASVGAGAATFSLVFLSSFRAVPGIPKPFTDRKRAFWLMPSSPTRYKNPRCRRAGATESESRPISPREPTQQRLNLHENLTVSVNGRERSPSMDSHRRVFAMPWSASRTQRWRVANRFAAFCHFCAGCLVQLFAVAGAVVPKLRRQLSDFRLNVL